LLPFDEGEIAHAQRRKVLRLKAAGLGKRKIAASLGITATAAGACLRRTREAGIAWAQAEEMTEEALEARLYPVSGRGSSVNAGQLCLLSRGLRPVCRPNLRSLRAGGGFQHEF